MNNKEIKHMIGALIVFMIINALINGFFGKVIFVVWVSSLIYAKFKNKLNFKEDPSLVDYFMVHYKAVDFSIDSLLKMFKK